MNAQANTSKEAARYHGAVGEPRSLGSSPHSASNWPGYWPSLALCIFLFEMRPDLWPSNFVFSSRTHSSNENLPRTSLSKSDRCRVTPVGRGLGPGCSASLSNSQGSSEKPQGSQNTARNYSTSCLCSPFTSLTPRLFIRRGS